MKIALLKSRSGCVSFSAVYQGHDSVVVLFGGLLQEQCM